MQPWARIAASSAHTSPGLYKQEDVNLNFDVSYAASDMVNVAAGTEWRDEKFTIGAGGRPSWEVGPQTTIDPNTLQLEDLANVPSTSEAAKLRGGVPLEPETSVNTTAGMVVDNGPFTLTADYFRVDVSDRLSLSQFFLGGNHRGRHPGLLSVLHQRLRDPDAGRRHRCRPTPRRISGATRC